MKGLIIQGSARQNGDTAKVADALAAQSGWDVVTLQDLDITPFDYNHQNKDDDFLPLIRRFVQDYELLCLATPIYWYTMSGPLKNYLDRFSDLLTIEKPLGRQLRGKSMALLSINHEEEPTRHFATPIELSAAYLGMPYKGHGHINMEQGITEIVQNKLDQFIQSI